MLPTDDKRSWIRSLSFRLMFKDYHLSSLSKCLPPTCTTRSLVSEGSYTPPSRKGAASSHDPAYRRGIFKQLWCTLGLFLLLFFTGRLLGCSAGVDHFITTYVSGCFQFSWNHSIFWFFPIHILKGNEKLLNMKDLLNLWLVPSRYSPWSFDPPPQCDLSLRFSHLFMLFLSIKPPAQPPLPAKGPVHPTNRAQCCNGHTGSDQQLASPLDLLWGFWQGHVGRLQVHEGPDVVAIPVCPPGTAVGLLTLQ